MKQKSKLKKVQETNLYGLKYTKTHTSKRKERDCQSREQVSYFYEIKKIHGLLNKYSKRNELFEEAIVQ